MNSVFEFFNKPVIQITIIMILIIIIICLISENFTDKFSNNAFERVPPNINLLNNSELVKGQDSTHHQAASQDPAHHPAASQDPSNSQKDGMSIDPPNYGRKNQKNSPNNTKMSHGNIYRMNTGREAYQQEQFVSIYDSNFGGMLGTNIGL